MAESPQASSARQRILQFGGRRFSLKLEPVFWAALAQAARARGLRPGKLVAQLAGEMPAGGNLASQLRVFCLAEAERRRQQQSERAARAELSAGATDIDTVVEHCPSPCLVMRRDLRILRVNQGFERWYGSAAAALAGKRLDHFFTLRTPEPLAGVIRGLGTGRLRAARAHLLYVVPGRVVASPAWMVPISRGEREEFAMLVFVEAQPGPIR